MPIRAETEILHDILGPIRFDDGASLPHMDSPSWEGQWVARPEEGSTDLEYYLAGGPEGPDPSSVERAVKASAFLDQIESQAREISGLELDLAWIDCTAEVTTVALTYDPEVSSLWEGPLDDGLRLLSLTDRPW